MTIDRVEDGYYSKETGDREAWDADYFATTKPSIIATLNSILQAAGSLGSNCSHKDKCTN